MFINKAINKIKFTITNYERTLLKNRAKHYRLDLVPEKQPALCEIVLENFFKTSYTKNALLSYVAEPFRTGIKNAHSNSRECYTMAEIMRDLGFNVDVINWDNVTFLPSKKYDLVIDNHNNLKRLSACFQQNTTRIFHATNAHWLYQNRVEYERYYDFFLQKGIAITPPRLIPPGNSAECCDAITMFGNDFTKNTYGRYKDKVHHVPVSVTSVPEMIERDFSAAKNKFLWLNSHGALLKGLDVVLTAFSKLPHLQLYVCADPANDIVFKDIYAELLKSSPNIILVGWVDVEGEAFNKLSSECAWIVGTSFSEGGGGSILNCMAKGLIPVISKTTSITLNENTGFFIEENNAESVAALINSTSTFPDAALRSLSYNAYQFVAANHTIDNFKEKYKQFLIKMLA